jgi:hypothetical protein
MASQPEVPWISIRNGRLIRSGERVASAADAAGMYRELGCSYPKFFKMDTLSKWAWLGAEVLLCNDGAWAYEGVSKEQIGLVLATQDGCLEADKKYADSMATVASPALFVYTLPNIMLGEICIRHGFKGEQLCLVNEGFDADALRFQAQDLLENRNLSHCLFGWADVVGDQQDICMFWASARQAPQLTNDWLEAVYQKN